MPFWEEAKAAYKGVTWWSVILHVIVYVAGMAAIAVSVWGT